MKRCLPFLLTAWWMLLGLQRSKAQYVTIPDSNFVNCLMANGFSDCMVGNQLDTTCWSVNNTYSLSCSWMNIIDLTGVQYFSGLKHLYCHNNDLSTLPVLPVGLEWLQCSHNNLTSLPTLPNTLKTLRCPGNPLTSFPVLPDSLNWLECHGTPLTTLPPLPDGLTTLEVGGNELTALPQLPPGLHELECSYNLLTTLPDLPASLYILNCSNNALTYLPDLPEGLSSLTCGVNQLTSLPELPSSLQHLRCWDNQLTSLPELPDSLGSFVVHLNPQLNCMPPLNKFTGHYSYSFNVSGTGITCLPNVIPHPNEPSLPAIDTMPICDVLNPNSCDVEWNALGNVFADDDLDCLIDGGEFGVPNVKLLLRQNDSTLQQVFTTITGAYSFAADTVGFYEVSIDTSMLPFSVTCPSGSAYGIDLGETLYNDSLDFGVSCGTGFDLGIHSIVAVAGSFFPGTQATVRIIAGDLAQFYFSGGCNTQGVSGTIIITVSGPATVASASVGATVFGNTVSWNIADFSLADLLHDYWIALSTDTLAQAGEKVCVAVYVSPFSDTDSLSNVLERCFEVVNSYDPNIKEVYPSTIQEPGDWHTYTVHFQNTGTAAAQNILIKDTLDPNLDWNSFQLLAYSHENLTQVLQNGIVHFNFPNIYLPDSNTNEPDSHGWIQYKIKTDSTIVPGTTVHNTAAIYFDFNDPVITSDALVTYCLPVETQQQFDICPGDSVQVGSNFYHQAGSYTNLFTNANGCDSTVVTTLGVSGVDTSLSVGSATIEANGTAGSYQWYNCTAGQPIAGAANQLFTPLQDGSYAVELTFGNGCTAMSSCVTYTAVGIDAVHRGVVNVYPNPSQGHVRFDFTGTGTLTLYNAWGQVLKTAAIQNGISFFNLPSGLVTYKLVSNDGNRYFGRVTVAE